MQKIKFSFEYGCYPIWIYDEDGIVDDNVLPDDIENHQELDALLDNIQDRYNNLFINNENNFEYIGFKTKEDKDKFVEDVLQAIDTISSYANDKYIFEADFDINTL